MIPTKKQIIEILYNWSYQVEDRGEYVNAVSSDSFGVVADKIIELFNKQKEESIIKEL